MMIKLIAIGFIAYLAGHIIGSLRTEKYWLNQIQEQKEVIKQYYGGE